MESSENTSKSKVGDSSAQKSLYPDEDPKLPTNLHKEPSNESLQNSSDTKNVNLEQKAGTSSEAEATISGLCIKDENSNNAASKSDSSCSFDRNGASENTEENLSTNGNDANDSFDSLPRIPDSNPAVQNSRENIDEALRQQYVFMVENCVSYDGENSSTCSLDLNPVGLMQASSDASTDLFGNLNLGSNSMHQELKSVTSAIIESYDELRRASIFPFQEFGWTGTSSDSQLLDALYEDSPDIDIHQAALALINRVSETIQDLNKLLKDLGKGPILRRMIRGDYIACSYDAGRAFLCKLNDNIVRNNLAKWPNIQLTLGRLSHWLTQAVLFARNLSLSKDLMISVLVISEMIGIVLKNDIVSYMTGSFEDIPFAVNPSNDFRFILDVKTRLASVVTKLISIVSYAEQLRRLNQA